ncbi:helix-turn-helix domain-containing protein [Kitasatospora sp. NPDC059571]|uniref:helix-turn-helix domain-containing protein n=1 Tax=Kitasatospora sp. NPDC059571 TaxID=3346871 RepID=UPI0036B23ACF
MTPNGAAIRTVRKAQGLGLRMVAFRIGKDRGFLSKVERGLAGASDRTLRDIAVVLDVPLQAIIREELT